MKTVKYINNVGKQHLKRMACTALLVFSFSNLLIFTAQAQPRARQQAQQTQKQQNGQALTTRAQVSFPTTAAMSEDVVWRRDIYREIDLNEDR